MLLISLDEKRVSKLSVKCYGKERKLKNFSLNIYKFLKVRLSGHYYLNSIKRTRVNKLLTANLNVCPFDLLYWWIKVKNLCQNNFDNLKSWLIYTVYYIVFHVVCDCVKVFNFFDHIEKMYCFVMLVNFYFTCEI